MEFSLLGAAVIGLGGLYAVLWWEAGRGNAADCTRDLWDILLTAGVVGLAAGRLAAMVGGGTNPLTHPGDFLIIRGGVDTGVAAAAALATAAFLSRRDLLPTLDTAAPAALAGLAGCVPRDPDGGAVEHVPGGQHHRAPSGGVVRSAAAGGGSGRADRMEAAPSSGRNGGRNRRRLGWCGPSRHGTDAAGDRCGT